jgi:hypothetical protein
MWWLWEIFKFTFSQCFGSLLTGAAPFAGPLAFLGLLWSRVFRSPSFFTLIRVAALVAIAATGVVVFWQQRVILRQLEETEKITAEGACYRHADCEDLKKTKPAIRYHEVHGKQCDMDKWRCDNSAEDRAWAIWVNSIPGWGVILDTIQSKLILVSFFIMMVSFVLPWFTGAPARAANHVFVNAGKKQLKAIIEDHMNPEGTVPFHED